MQEENIFNFIIAQEAAYNQPINVSDAWQWGMKDHIETSKLYKHSQLKTGKSDDKPVKNITRPILNLQYRAEGFDVKDIELFIKDRKNYYKSFLVRKYHDVYARFNNVDTMIDDIVESYVDYGGSLLKKSSKKVPEVVALDSVAFCNQKNLLSSPIGIRHSYSPDELLATSTMGWGDKSNGATGSLEDLLVLSQKEEPSKQGKDTKKEYGEIEVFEVHGSMPEMFLENGGSDLKYVYQTQIVSYYKDKDNKKVGFTLFKKKSKNPFKLLLRDKIFNRALGFGGAEELFDPQVWSTYGMIRMKDMLDSASKTWFKTTDATFHSRNKTIDADNNEVFVLKPDTDLNQIDSSPRNIQIFERAVDAWEINAQKISSASDALLGISPSSGTPFKLQELVTSEGSGTHKYRRGKIATFVDEVYRDWIIPDIVDEITGGKEFISDLSLKDLQYVADSLVLCETEKVKKEKVLAGLNAMTPEEISLFEDKVRNQFMSGGTKRFLKIFKDEMAKAPIEVFTNIAGKQAYLAERVDKIVNILRQVFANPQILEDKKMVSILNEILEGSGLSPVEFTPAPAYSEDTKAPVKPPALSTGAPAGQGAPQPVI